VAADLRGDRSRPTAGELVFPLHHRHHSPLGRYSPTSLYLTLYYYYPAAQRSPPPPRPRAGQHARTGIQERASVVAAAQVNRLVAEVGRHPTLAAPLRACIQ